MEKFPTCHLADRTTEESEVHTRVESASNWRFPAVPTSLGPAELTFVVDRVAQVGPLKSSVRQPIPKHAGVFESASMEV